MARTSATSARRGRRLLAAILGTLALAAATATLSPAPTRAAEPARPTATASSIFRSPRPTDSPTPTASPTCDPFSSDGCAPSPSPTIAEISPLPDSPTPSPTIPSYLQGGDPTPSAKIGETVSSPVPLGGGFQDQLPSPTTGTTVPTGTLQPHSNGLPVPFLAVGALLILGAVGSLIYAVAPREKNVFATPRSRPASPVMFTPYGPDAPGTNILSGVKNPPKGPTRPG